jgi:hypothetical protein
MISVQKFNLEVIKTYKCFYLLKNINDVTELQIVHNTPAGHIDVDVVDVFSMPNGKILIAWKPPFALGPMHNLLAISGSIVENVNLTLLERVIDIYDRPVDSQAGTFTFTNSDMIIAPNLDWRCDNGKFGPRSFHPVTILDGLPQINIYEPILSVNGVGHIIYIEGIGKQTTAEHHLNEDTHPVTGRTLWETLKLIREWSIVNQPPFNNTEAVAYKANAFIKELKFTEEELEVIDQQIPMQIANYLMGDTNARQRPNGILPITKSIKNLLFSRLASSSVSALEYLNPGIWDIDELLNEEKKQLIVDKAMFEISKKNDELNPLVVPIQERVFSNKELILNKVSENSL